MNIKQQWNQEDSDFIKRKVIEYNMKNIPNELKTPFEQISFVVKNDENELIGGITAHTFWHQMHIDFLWVSDELRSVGLGSKLLKKLEAHAVEKGCRVIQLDTFSFQAPEFYIKNGYNVIGVCKDFIEGSNQYYLEKRFRIDYNVEIRKLHQNENSPIDLLLLADPSIEKIRSYLNKGECYVAEIMSNIIGVYVLLPINNETAEIVNVAVHEKYQGQGIGKKLVLHAIQTARFLGFKTVEIGTGNSSFGQLALYQKCGFQINSIDKNFFTKNYPEAIYENGILCSDMIRLIQEL